MKRHVSPPPPTPSKVVLNPPSYVEQRHDGYHQSHSYDGSHGDTAAVHNGGGNVEYHNGVISRDDYSSNSQDGFAGWLSNWGRGVLRSFGGEKVALYGV